MFDDNGKIYVVHGQGTLYVTELNVDAKSVKGKTVEIWCGGFKNVYELGGGFGMEGSHAYKINGKYYITCPAGGAYGWQICLRSDSIYGPYEHKLIMNAQNDYPYGHHQGGMVQLKNGDWWFIIMQDRGAIGRTPNFVPVTWREGWPILGADGKDVVTYPKPNVGKTYPAISPATSDEFNRKKLGLQWQWNHNPDNMSWTLTERKGYMRLKALRADEWLSVRNTLTQRVQGPCSEGSVEIDITGLKDSNIAGFGILESPYTFVSVQQENGVRKIVMCNNGNNIETIEGSVQDKIWIRVRVTDRDFTARFYYSLDGLNFKPIGNVLKMGLGLQWMANRFALFNLSTIEHGVGGYVDFNWFRLTNK